MPAFDPQDELVRPALHQQGRFVPPEGDELVQPAPRPGVRPEAPGRGDQGFAVDALRSVLEGGEQPQAQPSQPQTVPELLEGAGQRIEQGRQFFGQELPREAGEATQEQLRLSGIHYRLLANELGLPVERPSEKDLRDYNRAVTEMLGTAAGAGVVGGATRATKGVAKFLGRGHQTRASAQRFMQDQSRHVVPPGSPRTTSRLKEAAIPLTGGAAAFAAVDFADPTVSEFWDSLIAAGAGIAAAEGLSAQAKRNLLLQDPKFRAAVMRASSAGLPSKALGGLIGFYLTRLAMGESNPEPPLPENQQGNEDVRRRDREQR